jgi:hypothetical protein
MDPLPDHAALKLGKGANDLKHQLAGWRCGVNELPVDEKINPTVFEMLHSRQQIDQGAPQAIDRPGHYNVKSALAGVFEHLVEAGPVSRGHLDGLLLSIDLMSAGSLNGVNLQ